MKKYIIYFVFAILLGMSVTGCTGNLPEISGGKLTEADEIYAIIMKAEGNPYNDLAVQGYQEIIEQEGQACLVKYPENATAEEQKVIIKDLIEQEVSAIAIAANDVNALERELKQAMEAGIKVSTLDSNTNPASRMTFVNQVATETVGQVLLDAVYDICDGEGQWAILSATSQAANQNEWIYAIREAMSEEKYSNMRLVDIVYGDDDFTTSQAKTRELLEKYPDLKVICAPTVVGINAAANVLDQEHTGTTPKLTGLGLPSEMAPYISASEDAICPYIYLWDPVDMGKLSAYVSLALVSGEITGEAGDKFSAGEMGEYRIIESSDGGTEVIVGEPLELTPENIDYWKELF